MVRKSVAVLLLISLMVSLAGTALASWTGYVTSTGLYIREKPSSSSKALKCPKNGAALTILDEEDGWYYVKYGVVYGYVSKKFVSSKKPASASGSSSSSSSSSSGTAANISEKTIADLGSAPAPMRKGDRGSDVVKLQKALTILGYLKDDCDGIYGDITVDAVKKYQRAKGLTVDGIAGNGTIRCIFGSTSGSSSGSSGSAAAGSVKELQWFNDGYRLMQSKPTIRILDCKSGISWKAKYINGSQHADIIPSSADEAYKIRNIIGNYERRPVIVTINGTMYAGSMYAVPHGETDYCSYFDGVMCIHFTGSMTHGSDSVDAAHQSAIREALRYYN